MPTSWFIEFASPRNLLKQVSDQLTRMKLHRNPFAECFLSKQQLDKLTDKINVIAYVCVFVHEGHSHKMCFVE